MYKISSYIIYFSTRYVNIFGSGFWKKELICNASFRAESSIKICYLKIFTNFFEKTLDKLETMHYNKVTENKKGVENRNVGGSSTGK